MFRFARRASARFSHLSSNAYSFAPLAGISARDSSVDPVFFVSGMAVLSAGLVVMRAAHGAAAMAPAAVSAREPARETRRYTAEEALAEREVRMGDREVLLNALAAAAETFYSIAGHLPRDASDRALGRADDLRELVWMNRAR